MNPTPSDLLRAIADGDKQLEASHGGDWSPCSYAEALRLISVDLEQCVRIARPMVTRTVTYPEPLRVKPEIGTPYFTWTHDEICAMELDWADDKMDNRIFDAGMAFATEADAAEAHKALFGAQT